MIERVKDKILGILGILKEVQLCSDLNSIGYSFREESHLKSGFDNIIYFLAHAP